MEKKIKGKNAGITLIALIITIIVLLILAGITINIIIGQDGIITRAKVAEEKVRKAESDEKVKLAIMSSVMDYIGNNIEYESLRNNLIKYFGEENVNIIENSNGSYSISINNGEYSYVIDKTGKEIERPIKVCWYKAYLNGFGHEDTYTNNVNIEEIIFYDGISKGGYRFKEWQMPDGSTATKEKIYNYIIDINNNTDLIITPIFEILDEYYTIDVKDRIQNVDYQITIDGVVQDENTFLKSQAVYIKSLDDNFSYWKYGDKIIAFKDEIRLVSELDMSKLKMISNDDSIDRDCIATIAEKIALTENEKNKFRILVYFETPKEYTVLEKGLLAAVGSTDSVNFDNCKLNSKAVVTATVFYCNVNITGKESEIVAFRPYIKVQDESGNEKVVFGEQWNGTWNELKNNQ